MISELPDQKRIEGLGGTMRLGGQEVDIRHGSLAEFLYRTRLHGDNAGHTLVRERFRHRYEVEPEYIERLEQGGLIFSGRHPRQPIMQILELPLPGEGIGHAPTHPFFIAGQFHPELTSRPLAPQPLFMGLVAATIHRKYKLHDKGHHDPVLTKWLRTPKGAPAPV